MKRNRKRPFKADAWVHVYKRRKDKFLLFYTTRDFLVYYTLFFCLAEKHKVRAYGLCIMVDHVHELLQASERERLENFERELNSRFAKEWNFAHNTVGQVFSRFGNSIKLGDKQKLVIASNAVNVEHFDFEKNDTQTPPVDLKTIVKNKKPIVGFYGALAAWIDFDMLNKLAKKHQAYYICKKIYFC